MNGWKPLTIFAKCSILLAWQDCKYISWYGHFLAQNKICPIPVKNLFLRPRYFHLRSDNQSAKLFLADTMKKFDEVIPNFCGKVAFFRWLLCYFFAVLFYLPNKPTWFISLTIFTKNFQSFNNWKRKPNFLSAMELLAKVSVNNCLLYRHCDVCSLI